MSNIPNPLDRTNLFGTPRDINNPEPANVAVPGTGFLGIAQDTVNDFQPTAFVDPAARTSKAYKEAQAAMRAEPGVPSAGAGVFGPPASIPAGTNQRTVLAHEAGVPMPVGVVIPDKLPQRK